MSKEQESIYQGHFEWGLGDHNVGEGVLRSSDQATMDSVTHHYGLRCGHIPKAENIGVVVHQKNDEISAQMNYLSEKFGRRIHVFSAPDGLPQNALISPYINTPDIDIVAVRNNLQIWGLPREMVMKLKDKAYSNTDINHKNQEGQTGLITPDNKIFDINCLAEGCSNFVKEVRHYYEKTGMQHSYPTGLMLRAAESDGGYGNVELKEERNKIRLVPNGEEKLSQEFGNWESALKVAQTLINSNINPKINSCVVAGRLIDYEAMPGLSVVINRGEVYSLGWNGQALNGNGKATVGVSKFESPIGTYAHGAQERHEQKTAEDLAKYLSTVAKDCKIDFSKVSGVSNVDLIIPGPKEREYLRRIGKNPDVIYAAEINPRWTNWTDALALVAWVEKFDHSISGFKQSRERNVVTNDKLAHSSQNSDELRSRAEEVNIGLAIDGVDGQLVVRMPDTEKAGFIFWGSKDGVHEAIKRAKEDL